MSTAAQVTRVRIADETAHAATVTADAIAIPQAVLVLRALIAQGAK